MKRPCSSNTKTTPKIARGITFLLTVLHTGITIILLSNTSRLHYEYSNFKRAGNYP